MPLNGWIDGPTFAPPTEEFQAAKFTLQNFKARVLGNAHLGRVRARRGIDTAKLQQEVPNKSLHRGRTQTPPQFPEDWAARIGAARLS